MRVPDAYKEIYEAALGQNWRVVEGGHGLKWFSPDGHTVVTTAGSKGAGYRTVQNVVSRLRRGGLVYGNAARVQRVS